MARKISATPKRTRESTVGSRPAAKTSPVKARESVKKQLAAAAPAAAAAKADGEPKLVRDSYTIPKAEYAALQLLKRRAVNLKRPAKKSELLRAGIAALAGLNDKSFLAALEGVPSLKTGRPKKASAG
jgi:hypothetical protein